MKVRENRLRRVAFRRGMRLVKSRAYDQDDPDLGRYRTETEAGTTSPVTGRQYQFAGLDDAEVYLYSGQPMATPILVTLTHAELAALRERARESGRPAHQVARDIIAAALSGP